MNGTTLSLNLKVPIRRYYWGWANEREEQTKRESPSATTSLS